MIEKVNISQVMNQCQIVTDTNYVYVELADGSQGKIKKSDLANVMNTLIGGLFPKLFSTPSAGNVKGFIIRTAISTAQYRAIRLQCSIGFNQNIERSRHTKSIYSLFLIFHCKSRTQRKNQSYGTKYTNVFH